MSRPQPADSLAERQSQFIAAMTGTSDLPDGFDQRLFTTARDALLRKRCAEVRERWPALERALGDALPATFSEWAAKRPTQGATADGRAFARSSWHLLDPSARRAVAEFESTHRICDGSVVHRRGLAIRYAGGQLIIGWRGRRIH